MKLFHVISTSILGAAVAFGVGLAATNNKRSFNQVNAAEETVVWNATNGSLGSGIGSGTISTGSFSWSYTRTLKSGESYSGWTSNCVQLGKNGGVENISFSTTNIPGTIKRVSIECASYNGAHKVAILVGGTSYLASTQTSSWTTVSEKTGTGSSSGQIQINFTNGTRALYIKSLTVVYEEASGPDVEEIDADLKEPLKLWKKGQSFTVSDVSVYVLYADLSDKTVTDGVGVKFGPSANLNSVTLVAGNNNIIVNYGGKTDSVTVFARAVTELLLVTDKTTLNSGGSTSVSTDVAYEVSYNNDTIDYAATFTCPTAGWSKTADDGNGNVTFTFESNGSFTFTLTANDDDEKTEEVTFTVSGIPTVEYALFSGEIEEGQYIICSGTNALKAEITSNRGAYATISPVDGKVSTPPASIVWDIEEATIDQKVGFTIQNSAGYFSATDSDNNATLLSTATSKSVWAVSGTDSYEFVNQNPKSSNKANLRLNAGYGFACYSTSTGGPLTLYKLVEEEKTVTNSRMTIGTVSASTGDTKWTLSGFAFEVLYEGDSEYTNVTNKTTFDVNKAVPQIDDDGTLEVTVTPTFKGVEYTAKAANVNATLTYINIYTIAQLYDPSATLSEYEVDGIFMGEVVDGYIFMNGEYGILDYDKTHSKTLSLGGAYSLNGTRSLFSGLVELTNTTATELPNGARKNHIQTPVIYEVTGSETSDKANRKTSLTGTVKSMTSTKTGSDSTVVVTVNSSDITVFVKSSLATETIMNALVASKNTSKSITIEGFTSWHSGFQVSLTDVVIPVESYSIYDFAKDLLKLTRTTCTGGDFDLITNKSTLTTLWSTLSGAEYYGKLDSTKKATLATGSADKDIVVPNTDVLIDAMTDTDALGAALYRYDYCTAKYELTTFIEGRTLSVSFGSNVSINVFGNKNRNTIVIIAVISTMVALTSVGCFFIIRKKKHN